MLFFLRIIEINAIFSFVVIIYCFTVLLIFGLHLYLATETGKDIGQVICSILLKLCDGSFVEFQVLWCIFCNIWLTS